MRADYYTECGICYGEIEPGTPVQWHSQYGPVHEDEEICEPLDED